MMRFVALFSFGMHSLAKHETKREQLLIAGIDDDTDPELVPVVDDGVDDSDIVDHKVDQFMNPGTNPGDMVKAMYDFSHCAKTCERLLSILGGSQSEGDQKNRCFTRCEKCAALEPPQDLDGEKKNTGATQAYRRECMEKDDDNDDESERSALRG
eukprot:GEMP01017196.1.p1 GENE.GEMP01017196.1~~GEMP01017196.1.p1  ORF type:complete len:165 (+),score=29.00 GEMP01017196.1:31-495(+)